VARESRDRLAAELAALLSELEAAIPARFQEPHRHAGRRRRPEPPRQLERLREALVGALRWLRPGA
jgi:hypothetical protein